MSATTAAAAHELPRRSRTPGEVPTSLTIFATGAVVLSIGLISVGLWEDRDAVVAVGWGWVVWLAAVALVGLASVPSARGPQLGLDLPLLLAAGFLFGPAVGAALGFLGYVDLREFRGEISLLRALYNRAQVGLSVMLGAVVFGLSGGQVTNLPSALPAALLALAADCLLNYSLVAGAKGLHEGTPPFRILGAMTVGTPRMFGLTYLCYGLLSLILGQAYTDMGAWGLALFAIPVVLGHQAFIRGRRLEAADERLRSQSEALRDASSRLAEERRDERLAVAAGLHDEVLPPLYNIHLMAQVLRRDLADGRLLDLEDDIPELLRAVTSASDATRALISGLRKSPLGAAGFRGTLLLLVEHLQTLSSARFSIDVEEIDGPPIIQLLAYQVIRESLNNAVRHAAASQIRVVAGVQDGAVRVIVEDDGRGFLSPDSGGATHFGLSMMRERVELVGGILHVESSPGAGTRVVARLPVEVTGSA